MIFISPGRSIFIVTIICFSTILLLSEVDAGGMMGGGMMGGKKGGGGHSGVEAMLVAGILAKLLGGNEKSSGGSHPMYIPVPMVYHSMGGYGMGGHPMSGGYSMGGHGMSW